MTESTEKFEAMQAVVDRVSSYQEAAPESTTATELREAFDATDLEVSDQEIAQLTEAIEADPSGVDVATVLG